MTLCRAAVSVQLRAEIVSFMSPLTSPLMSLRDFKGAISWVVKGRWDFYHGTCLSITVARESTRESLLQMCPFVISCFAWSTDFAAKNDQISSCKATTGTDSWEDDHTDSPLLYKFQNDLAVLRQELYVGAKHSQAWPWVGMGALVVGRGHQVLCSQNKCAHVPVVSDRALAGFICGLAQ